MLGSVRGMSRPIKTRQRHVHKIAARIQGTGTATVLYGSKELTITDNGTGDYTLTFSPAALKTPIVTGLVLLTSASSIRVSALSTTTVRILSFGVDGTTAKDTDFHIGITLVDCSDEY